MESPFLFEVENLEVATAYLHSSYIFTYLEYIAQSDEDTVGGGLHFVALVEVEQTKAVAAEDAEALVGEGSTHSAEDIQLVAVGVVAIPRMVGAGVQHVFRDIGVAAQCIAEGGTGKNRNVCIVAENQAEVEQDGNVDDKLGLLSGG